HLQLLELTLPGAMQEYDGITPRMSINRDEPTIIIATFAGGRVALCNDEIGRPLALGFPVANDRPGHTRFPIYADTGRRDWLPDSMGSIDRPLHPGCADRYRVSLRFGDETASTDQLAGDVVARFRAAHPPALAWPDRRPIGSLHLSSSVPHLAANPRGWLGNDAAIDTTTDEGRADLASRLTAHVDGTIVELARVGAQGVIIWDIEGQEHPHATSYIGDPRQLPPEMEPIADGLFARLTAAGLRTGLCIRPQVPVRGAYTGDVHQAEVPTHEIARVLNEKIAHARARWGCTLFYVDSNVTGPGWRITDPAIFRQVAAANPDVLLIPEHETCAYWATTAPYHELRQGWTGTPDSVRAIYPDAFSVVYVSDGDTAGRRAELIAAVQRGDVLLFRGWWPDPFNDDVIAITREAHR
nr:hypothetical protein [Planctomycetota bacterium]